MEVERFERTGSGTNSRVGDLQIARRGCEIGVAEQSLDGAKIHAELPLMRAGNKGHCVHKVVLLLRVLDVLAEIETASSASQKSQSSSATTGPLRKSSVFA